MPPQVCSEGNDHFYPVNLANDPDVPSTWQLSRLKMLDQADAFPRKQFVPPNFTTREIRDSVPQELLELSFFKSTGYLAISVMSSLTLAWTAIQLTYFLPQPLNSLIWLSYWILQPVIFAGFFNIGHECGHLSFCDSKIINHAVGLFTHGILLVPYFSLRISHAKHHAHTAHVKLDELFPPDTLSDRQASPSWTWAIREAIEESPMYTLGKIIYLCATASAAYVLFHVGGPKYPRWTSHYHPTSPLFEKHQRAEVLFTDGVLVLIFGGIAWAMRITSVWTVAKLYLIPVTLFHGLLFVIIFLQHTDVYIPKYGDESWTFTRGALATVDHDFGWFFNHITHHSSDSHVAHHIFSKMPHYNAIQATPYLRKKLGEYYFYDKTPLWKAIYRVIRNCNFVDDTNPNNNGVMFFQRK